MSEDKDYFKYREFLHVVALEDVRRLEEKDRSYNGSWKRGGGRSAWFMLRRKMDRLIEIMRPPAPPPGWPTSVPVEIKTTNLLLRMTTAEDIFAMIQTRPGGEDGTVLAEVRDLRRYLLLVEADMVARGVVEDPDPPLHRPNGRDPDPKWGAKPGKYRGTLDELFEPGTSEDGGHHGRHEEKD